MDRADVSVVIPTIGRPQLLEQALASLRQCDPRPAEIVVVDQSGEPDTSRIVAQSGLEGARVVRPTSRGIGLAVNCGLRESSHQFVFIVHDDCTVATDWIAAGLAAMRQVPDGIVTGRVLPVADDPRAVPSCIVDEQPHDFTGEIQYGVLYPNNMVCPASTVLEFGGFDESIVPAAEDNDLCYRWLRAGRRLRYLPELLVHHHDWRSPDELEALYVGYHQGQGMFYAKHLRDGDLTVLRFIVQSYANWIRSLASWTLRGTPRWADERRAVFRGLPLGLIEGWKTFKPRS